MTQPRSLDDLVRRISAALPPGISQMNDEVRKNLREVLSASLSRMDLVSREEFEVQSAVLARTREKLERLEAKVAELEATKRGQKTPSRG